MYIKNLKASLIYKIIVMAVAGYCVLLNLGVMRGEFKPMALFYFTILSNVFCFVYMIFAVVGCAKAYKKGADTLTVIPHFKGGIMMAVMVTFLIYHFVLLPQSFSMDNSSVFRLPNILAHYVVPFMFWADWALFDKKGVFRPYDPLLWALVPLGYLFMMLIRAEVSTVLLSSGSLYPYFFIDVDALGGLAVFINVLLFAAFFMALGYVLYFLDRGLGKIGRRTVH